MKKISGGYEICGAVYIGGRVIVTAAHCIEGPFWFKAPCEDDGDCPDLSSELNGEVDVTCEESPINPATTVCVDTSANADNQANNPYYVRFGSVYPELHSDGEIRKSVQIEYCRAVDIEAGGGAGDFAYCILSEKPNIQPVPIIVPCEVDAEMAEGTTIVAVGPGLCLENNEYSGGTKRWASGELESDLKSTSTIIGAGHLPYNWFTDPIDDCGAVVDDSAGGADVYPTHGDSGSGVYAELSDGTWRLVAITVTNADVDSVPLTKHVSAIAAFGGHPELVALVDHDIARMSRSSCGYNTGWSQALSQPISGGTQPLSDLELVPSSNPANWRRVAVAGNLGWMLLQ